MKAVICMDSLKGSLSSLEAGKAVAAGIRRIYPDAEVRVRPLADGGEGTVEALALGMQGRIETITVTGPLGKPVECKYGIIDETVGGPDSTSTSEHIGNVGSSSDLDNLTVVGDSCGSSGIHVTCDVSSLGSADITSAVDECRNTSTGDPAENLIDSVSEDVADNYNAGDVNIRIRTSSTSDPADNCNINSAGQSAGTSGITQFSEEEQKSVSLSGICRTGHTAVIEMAGAAGITLVPAEQRNPLNTSTYGVGEVIKDAIVKGCRDFIIGIGGSATNDGGIGMLQALGYEFLDESGNPIASGARGLKQLREIRSEHVLPELAECHFRVACDVTNPLCGEKGCSAVFGPQKGATASMIREMDAWLKDYAALAAQSFPKADPDQPGCGAAGGLGFAFLTFTNASLESGIRMILEETRLEDYIKDCDFVITGEGRLDSQTVMGKAPAGVAALAKKYGKKVIAFSGAASRDAVVCNQHGIDAFFPILRNIVTLKEAMEPERTAANLADTAEQVFRLIRSLQCPS